MNDITIIGAGPAGSAAAIFLLRAGKSPTLIEQHRFPRDKVCGECISAVGIDVLRRLGVGPALQRAGAVPLTRALIHAGTSAPLEAVLPRPMLGVSRHVLDALLLDAAREAGAQVMQPVRCEGVFPETDARARSVEKLSRSATSNRHDQLSRRDFSLISVASARLQTHAASSMGLMNGNTAAMRRATGEESNHGITFRIRNLQTNDVQTLGASLLILADGKSALSGAPPDASGDIGVKSHWTNVDGPRNAIELFGCAGCYGGLAAIEGGRWNAAFSIPAGRAKAHHGDLDALFAELMSQSPALSRRLRHATRAGPWLASPLPRFGVRAKWPPGMIPIGNAAAALEPIGGEGMGLALRSAEIAAAAIVAAGDCWSAQNERALRRAYNALWRMRRLACRATAMIVSSKSAADAAVALSRNNPSLAKLAMAWMGK